MMLEIETYDAFGYHLTDITTGSHKYIVYLCPICKERCITQRRYYTDEHCCDECNHSKGLQGKHTDEFKQLMSTLRTEGKIGPKLLTHDERISHRKRTMRECQRRRRMQLIHKLENRLRVSLHAYLNGTVSRSKNLSFSSEELVTHIQKLLQKYDNCCPMCGVNISERFDVDHIIPLCSAKTTEELIELYELENLNVLCPRCNQHIKGSKMEVLGQWD